MRTIVALFACTIAMAQAPGEIDRLEKTVADKPESIGDRVTLLNRLTNRAVALPPDRVREARRRHIAAGPTQGDRPLWGGGAKRRIGGNIQAP